MTAYYNPALYEEPRDQPMTNVPPIPRESLLGWLEATGRFKSSEMEEFEDHKIAEDLLDDILDPEIYASENDDEELN